MTNWKEGEETLPADEAFNVMPDDVRRRLIFLDRENMNNQKELAIAERNFFDCKGNYEIAMAHSRILYGDSRREDGKPFTEAQKDDFALRDNEELYRAYMTSDASVRIVRAMGYAIQNQIETTRSISASVKSEIILAGGFSQ